MKQVIFLLVLILVTTVPAYAQPGGPGRGHGVHGGGMHRPPMGSMHRPPAGGIHHPPMGGMHRPPVGGVHRPPIGIAHRPPLPPPHYRPIRPLVYSSFGYYPYYPVRYYSSYSYYPVTSYVIERDVDGTGTSVIVREEPAYAGINTAANVINAAANAATAIKFLSW